MPSEGGGASSQALLRVRDLCVTFGGRAAPRWRAVDGVSLTIHPRQTLAVVGESGSGKSVTALSILGLVAHPGRIERGTALWKPRATTSSPEKGATDLFSLPERRLRDVRGGEIAMIFQEPMTSLNPVVTVGDQIAEAVMLHQRVSRSEARAAAEHALSEVGVPEPARRVRQYPHQFSGGMRQRVMIAMALACRPSLLLADEPTTALDVTIQAQILGLLRDIKRDRGMSIMLISHDLGVVAQNADVVCVMYAGRVVEYASVFDLFRSPLHPYTRALLACVPRLGERRDRLLTIREVIEAAPLERDADADSPARSIHPRLSPPLHAWWPGLPPPEDQHGGLADPAMPCVLRQVEPGRWVAIWNTRGATELLNSDAHRAPPDLGFRRP
ncbi:MAG: ABC transporter ATP-binding protein [Planctomycetota bacterium]|nr:ABC transporter ATP-binding protein [Planctomycetota bacterium]